MKNTLTLKTLLVLAAAVALVSAFAMGTTMVSAQDSARLSSSTDMQQFCNDLADRLGGIPVPNGDVCDVVVVRQSPQIMHDGMDLNKFTLMNSVLEFMQTGNPREVFVMGDFSLLESEMNPVLDLITRYGWTVTGIHNHMILESPKLTFMHWEATGNVDRLVSQINSAFAQTSIK